jgi:hypothetical protein
MLCPECDAFDVTLLQGRELRIDSIETSDETDDPAAAAVQEQE